MHAYKSIIELIPCFVTTCICNFMESRGFFSLYAVDFCCCLLIGIFIVYSVIVIDPIGLLCMHTTNMNEKTCAPGGGGDTCPKFWYPL